MAPKARKRLKQQRETAKGDSNDSQNGKTKKDKGEGSDSSSGTLTKLVVLLAVAAVVGFAAAVHLGYIDIKQLQELNGVINPDAETSQPHEPIVTEAKENEEDEIRGDRMKRDTQKPKKEKQPKEKRETAPEEKLQETKTKQEKKPEVQKKKAPKPEKEKAPEPKKEKVPETKKEKAPESKKEKAPEPKEAKAPEPKKEKAPEPKEEKAPEPKKEKAPEPKKEKAPEPKKEKAPEPKKENAPEPKKEKVIEQKGKFSTKEKKIPEPKREAEVKKEEAPKPKKEKAPEPKTEKAPEPKKEKAPEPKKEKAPEPKKDKVPESKKERAPEPKKEKAPELKKEKAPEPKKDKAQELKKEKVSEPKNEKAPVPKKEKAPEAKKETAPEPKKDKAPELKKEKAQEPKKEKVPELKNDKAPELKEEKVPEPKKERAPESKQDLKEEGRIKDAQKKEPDVKEDKNSQQRQKKNKREEVIVEGRTNSYDKTIEKELDVTENLLSQGKLDAALRRFEKLMASHPASPRARLGRAKTLQALAEEQRSNDLLKASINAFEETARAPNCPKEVLIEAVITQADRLKFLGNSVKAVSVLEELNTKIPNDVKILKELGVAHLIRGSNKDAKPIFQKILQLAPEDGHAKVHLGFILKSETKYNESIPLLQEGIATGDEGTHEGKYYFHLGDALYRVGKIYEAYEVYNTAADKGFFLSKWQRSLYNVDSLTAKPWWTPQSAQIAKYAKLLEDNWKVIRDEGLANLDSKTGAYVPEVENLRETGDWKQFTLYSQGKRNDANCKRAPKTCAIIDQIPMAISNKRGQIKFSVLHPGTHIWAHCGPTNCRLRSHLGLVVPDGLRIRVKDETRTWQEGKLLMFDDSFEHEVWHEGSSLRLILIMDIWHPELTDAQKKKLTAI